MWFIAHKIDVFAYKLSFLMPFCNSKQRTKAELVYNSLLFIIKI